MKSRLAIPRALVVASTTVALSAAVALAFAPQSMRHAAERVLLPTMHGSTRDARAPDRSDLETENAPAAGTYCPIGARDSATAPKQGTSSASEPDSSALLLLERASQSGASPAPDATPPANCSPAPQSSGQPR